MSLILAIGDEPTCIVLGITFMASLAYAILGQLFLVFSLRWKGVKIHNVVAGLPLSGAVLYWRHRREMGTRGFDLLAITSAASLAIALISWLLIFPLGWC